MSRKPSKPWFRAERGPWFVCVKGKQVNLGPDKEQAERKFHELLARPPDQPAFTQAAEESVLGIRDRFLTWCREHRKPETYEWYRWRLQEFTTHLKRAALTGLTVPRLKPFHLDEWLAERKDWSSGTKHGRCRAVQRAMRWAEKKGYLDRSPLAHYEKPRPGKRTTVIPPAEYEVVLANAGSPQFRDLRTVHWETGCRPQESVAVEARHVDLATGRWVFPPDESKGQEWPRVVYLTDRGLETTRRLMADHPDGPLFRNSDGKPWTPYAVNCAFTRIQVRLGLARMKQLGIAVDPLRRLPVAQRRDVAVRRAHRERLRQRQKLVAKLARQHGKKYCLYTIRHSWTDRALKSGVDALTVAILLGHRDPSTLSKVYQHLSQSPDYLREATRKAGGSQP